MKIAMAVAWLTLTVVMTWGIVSLSHLRKEVYGQQTLLSRAVKNLSLNQHIATQALKACERRPRPDDHKVVPAEVR